MKNLILLVSSIIITGCTSSGYNGPHEFDWMPEQMVWEQNIRNCRSADVCRAETLFRR
jgi:outer membrane biogenesis lipoprotein LolB